MTVSTRSMASLTIALVSLCAGGLAAQDNAFYSARVATQFTSPLM